MSNASARLLVIRFSSFGDIVQAEAVPAAFQSSLPDAKVDWLVRSDFKVLLTSHPLIDRVICFDRSEGLIALIQLAWRLGAEPYSHIYDAHNNVRSLIVSSIILFRRLTRLQTQPFPKFLRRSKDRLRRFLFFRGRMRSAIQMPFKGVVSFLRPMKKWDIQSEVPKAPQFFLNATELESVDRVLMNFKPDVALVPSAAWEMKRWPLEYWRELIALLPEYKFAILGGPEDHFCSELEAVAPERVKNFAGKFNLQGSSAIIQRSRLTLANDTGLLHVADQLGRPTIALIGPTAFGYPSHSGSETAEVDLPCKPCSKDGRGVCVNAVYKKCLLDVTPPRVAERIRAKLGQRSEIAL